MFTTSHVQHSTQLEREIAKRASMQEINKNLNYFSWHSSRFLKYNNRTLEEEHKVRFSLTHKPSYRNIFFFCIYVLHNTVYNGSLHISNQKLYMSKAFMKKLSL
uniref:Uncharacterized protein n=1 Tax=Anguilla anguilla TaxID=7936 RepID=A0A0E9WQ03_ANGAN